MTQQPSNAREERPDYLYHLLRAATELYQAQPAALDDAQLAAVRDQARKTLEIEDLVLNSTEAQRVTIADSLIEESYETVRGRYAHDGELEADLAANGLDTDVLRRALQRELVFDAVMQRVGAHHAAVSETDERQYYEAHRDRFETTERRSARHILITINDAYDENTRAAAMARLERIAERLRAPGKDPFAARFADEARRHSECPTALQEGKLGAVARGQLYAALDTCLFGLEEGAMSGPIESPMGLHLLLCERIEVARLQPFHRVRKAIHDALVKRRQRENQRSFLDHLRGRRTQGFAI